MWTKVIEHSNVICVLILHMQQGMNLFHSVLNHEPLLLDRTVCLPLYATCLSLLKEVFFSKSVLKIFIILIEQDCPEATNYNSDLLFYSNLLKLKKRYMLILFQS